MAQVVIDNIGFSLQKMGGLSVVWGNLLKVLSESGIDYVCMEYPGCMNNMIRKDIKGLELEEYKPLTMRMERYKDVSIDSDKPFIFHSSHYRICENPNAINITTVHDFTYERYRRGIPKWVHSWQKFRAIRKADIVVCISESTKKDVMHYLPDVSIEKIRVIHNGVSLEYKPVISSMYQEMDNYIVFVGSRYPYKKFDYLIESIVDTNYNLAIVGSPLSKSEISFLNEKIGMERYKYMGFLTNEQLNELYNKAFCLAYPSVYEGFGIPVLEAQRAGCPVIAYDASSIPEVIGETPLLLTKLTKENLLSKLELLKDQTERNRVIKAGLENSKKFSWTKMGAEYITLYNELIDRFNIH